MSNKTKLSVATLAVLTALGMGYSSLALATGTPTPQVFTANINVHSDIQCPIVVTTPTADKWDLDWTYAAAGPTSALTYVAGTTATPLPLSVAFDTAGATPADASCIMNKVTFAGDAAANVPVAGSTYKHATSNGGFWRFIPVIAKAEMFSDVALVTPITAGDVHVTNAGGTDVTSGAATAANATGLSTAWTAPWVWAAIADVDPVPATDGYLGTVGYVPLTAAGAGDTVTLENQLAGTDAKSARIGMGVILASNPEDAAGALSYTAVRDGDTVSIPFTVNVDLI
jgi:hypothetical protein